MAEGEDDGPRDLSISRILGKTPLTPHGGSSVAKALNGLAPLASWRLMKRRALPTPCPMASASTPRAPGQSWLFQSRAATEHSTARFGSISVEPPPGQRSLSVRRHYLAVFWRTLSRLCNDLAAPSIFVTDATSGIPRLKNDAYFGDRGVLIPQRERTTPVCVATAARLPKRHDRKAAQLVSLPAGLG